MEHVALFREELGTGVRVTVSTTARFMGLCGLQLLEHPERLRVFGFESAKPGDGQLAPFKQFAGTFQGRYFPFGNSRCPSRRCTPTTRSRSG